MYRFHEIPVKIPMAFFAEMKKILNFIWNLKGLWIFKQSWKKTKTGKFTFPNFKTYYKAIKDYESNKKQYGTSIRTNTETNRKKIEAQKQTLYIWPIDFQQGYQGYSMGKEYYFEPIDFLLLKNE